jgi:cytochrome c-type biogenesis protein
MFDVGFVIAFWSGVVSFFAPCVFPLIPGYMTYISGVSYKELYTNPEKFRKRVFLTTAGFVIGFTLIFVLLGATAGGVGFAVRRHVHLISRLGGLLILLAGMNFAGFINWEILSRGEFAKLGKWFDRFGYLRSVIVGMTFGVSWTPCIGAILGSILTLAASTQTAGRGALLLATYAFGMTVPFMGITFLIASLPKLVKRISVHIPTITRVSGVLLMLVGIMLLTDTYGYFNGLVWELYYSLGIGY